MPQRNNVCRPEPISKDKFKHNLAAAWGRVWPKIKKGAMADAMGLTDVKTIDRAITGANLPEAHTIFNSLLADETALNEVLAYYGLKIAPITAVAANDLDTIHGLCETASELSAAVADGYRDHRETLRVADKLRPHMPAMEAILREAETIRGAA